VGCVMLGALGAAAELVYRSPAPSEEERQAGPPIFGPGSYAGPGWLERGGVRLRR